jgi:hypothetical protein
MNETTQNMETTRTRHDSMVNKARLRLYALDVAAQRHHRFTRVGGEFIDKADAQLRTWVRDYIRNLPSKGKTIK